MRIDTGSRDGYKEPDDIHYSEITGGRGEIF
jgi:hypothetical protein